MDYRDLSMSEMIVKLMSAKILTGIGKWSGTFGQQREEEGT